LAEALGVTPQALLDNAGSNAVRESSQAYLRPSAAWDTPADLPAGQFGFLQHLDAYLSAGNGGPSADSIERTDKATPFRSDWLAAQGWNTRTHFTMRCKGDSMEPTVQDGAPVVIDTSDRGRTVQSGRVYAISIDGELLLKRLDRLPGGLLRVRSDNLAPMYSAFELPESSIEVVGRAVWTPVNL
jgi:phage repressor protein C with HTH and peptisase S24 domain